MVDFLVIALDLRLFAIISDGAKSFDDYILFCYANCENVIYGGTIMDRHMWTYLENEICCRRYLQIYVVEHSDLSCSDFVRQLKKELPHLKETSLRRKISNIKYLANEARLSDSMQCMPSANYSADNKKAFNALLREYGLC